MMKHPYVCYGNFIGVLETALTDVSKTETDTVSAMMIWISGFSINMVSKEISQFYLDC